MGIRRHKKYLSIILLLTLTCCTIIPTVTNGNLPNTAEPTPIIWTIENAVMVPTDLQKIDYRELYKNPDAKKIQVGDPFCAVARDEMVFPAEYLGENGFPEIKGTPLPAEIKRLVGLKDAQIPDPSLYDCHFDTSAKMREGFLKTIERARDLGADEITFTNYLLFADYASAQLEPPDKAGLKESDFRMIANKAKETGLGVTLELNLALGSQIGSAEIPSANWLGVLIRNWGEFVLDQARLAEETGVRAMMINHFDYQPGINGFEDIYQEEMLTLLTKVRKVFSGKILVMIENMIWDVNQTKLSKLLTAVDGFIFTVLTTPLSNVQNKEVSVANLKPHYLESLGWITSRFNRFKKPYLVRILVQSEKTFLENGWNEDIFCIKRENDPCYQANLKVDFSLQAVAYEAVLETLAQAHTRKNLTILGVETNGYWFMDVVLPHWSQPQIAQSIRNKPAESIVYEWFKRPK